MFIAGAGKCGGTPLGVRCAVPAESVHVAHNGAKNALRCKCYKHATPPE